MVNTRIINFLPEQKNAILCNFYDFTLKMTLLFMLIYDFMLAGTPEVKVRWRS